MLSIRVLPTGQGDGGVAELYRKGATATIAVAGDGQQMRFRGDATLRIHPSNQDPLLQLPVRRVVHGEYVEISSIRMDTGEVLRRHQRSRRRHVSSTSSSGRVCSISAPVSVMR